MRECRKNYAHGPMKISTKEVSVDYKGEKLTCSKTFYGCKICGFELHEKWMEEKLQKELESLYHKKHQ